MCLRKAEMEWVYSRGPAVHVGEEGGVTAQTQMARLLDSVVWVHGGVGRSPFRSTVVAVVRFSDCCVCR